MTAPYDPTDPGAPESSGEAARRRWLFFGSRGWPPHGWVCTGVVDLMEDEEDEDSLGQCQVWATRIRYQHEMEHPEVPTGRLGVGCICAGWMEENVPAAQAREREARNRSDRRRKWLSRRWQTSRNGNRYIRANGFHAVVYPRGGAWEARVSLPRRKQDADGWWTENGEHEWFVSGFATEDAARLGAFDTINSPAGQAAAEELAHARRTNAALYEAQMRRPWTGEADDD